MHVDNPADIELVDAEAIAGMFGVSKQFVYRLAQENALPHFRIGHAVRFDRNAVLGALMRYRSEPMAAGGHR